MPSSRFIGTHIQLAIQTKFPTFTPDLFAQALKDKGFTSAQAQTLNPQAGQSLLVQTFSKGNLLIFLLPSSPQAPPQITFQILNTIDLKAATSGESSISNTIAEILAHLNIVPDVILSIGFNCTTMITTTKKPTQVLTSGFRPEMLKAISTAIGQNLEVLSIRLGTVFPIQRKGLQIYLEPLGVNPDKQYFMNIIFQTDDQNDYNAFISQFGEKQIEEIVKAVSGDV